MAALRRPIALLAVLAAMLASCTTTEAEPGAEGRLPVSEQPADVSEDEPSGGTLRIGLPVDPVSIDPRFVVDDEGELIVSALFEPLVRLDERSRVVPGAAASWEVSEDGREFTFRLRRARFHDGSPVSASDFERSFDRIADGTASPPSFLAYLLAPVEGVARTQRTGAGLSGVEAVGERTLVIRLSQPQPSFLRTLSDPSLVPIPASADTDPEAFAEQPVGNGPFAMREPREPNAFLRLSRNEDHWRPPLLDEVLFQIYADDATRTRQWEDVLAGQLQIAEVPAEHLGEAAERYGRSPDGYSGPGLLDGITSTVYLYGFDTTQPPFDDPRVRRAISLSIDRDALADDVMQGTRVAADALVPPPFLGSQQSPCDHCRFDPDAAAELMDEVRAEREAAALDPPQEGDGEQGPDERSPTDEGSDAPAAEDDEETGESEPDVVPDVGPVIERLTLTHNRGRTHAAIAERMASDIEEALGVDVALSARDLQPFVQAIRLGEVPVFRLGWDPGEADAGGYLFPLFHSSHIGADNVTRYENEEVDALLEQARSSRDAAAGVVRYQEAERLILDDAPAIPLLWYRHSTVVAAEVQNLYWSPLGRLDLASVSLDPQA